MLYVEWGLGCSKAVTQIEFLVPPSQQSLPHKAPNSWVSRAFGQPPVQMNSGVRVSFKSLLRNADPGWHRATLSCNHKHIDWGFRLVIHKVFSKAIIYPIGLSLNAFEWDQSNYNLQCLMVKRENEEERKQWSKAGSAFMWSILWKPP